MSEFEVISAKRKRLTESGEVPEWYTTQGLLMFERKYAFNGETVRESFWRVANHLGALVPEMEGAKQKFFDLMWSGKLAPSTPVLCNVGTGRGHPVSCSGGFIGDSIDEFYKNHHENAMLSKKGYGTSSYLGSIRPRGDKISSGGEADGVIPQFDSAIDVVRKVSQGNNRRGNWAGYLEVDHEDFYELAGYVQKNPASANVGWIFKDAFIERLVAGEKDAVDRFNKVCYLRARSGKGYIWKSDTANKLSPQAIKNSGITIKGSNLCSEIALPQDADHTFSCVLSSINLLMWDSIEDEDIEWMIVFLDAVVTEMLNLAKGHSGFERIVRFTEKSRALGLGTLGLHSYFQSKMLPFDSFDARLLNTAIYSRIQKCAIRSSQNLAKVYGEPEWCKGTGMRNATTMAIAPNTSSALLCGGVSQSIEPLVTNAFNQPTAAGEMTRMNPQLVETLKEKGIFSVALMKDLAMNFKGSVQHMTELTEHEKLVFRTAFEIDQMSLVQMASSRQRFIDQGQSLNLFFSEDEVEIAGVIKAILLDDYIKGAYYQRSMRGATGSTGDCLACEG